MNDHKRSLGTVTFNRPWLKFACILVMSASRSNWTFHSKWPGKYEGSLEILRIRRDSENVPSSESQRSAMITSTEPLFAAIVIHSEENPCPSGVVRTYCDG